MIQLIMADKKIIPPKMSKPTIELLIVLVTLGVAEKMNLQVLFWLSFVLAIIVSLIMTIVLIAYAIGFWKGSVCESCNKSK
jgi:hypothetical protein